MNNAPTSQAWWASSALPNVLKRIPGARSGARYLRRAYRPAWLGTVRRTRPLSDFSGYDRGTPVDRYYIDSFIAAHRGDIRGCVLEIQDARYTSQFGRAVERIDVLDIDPANPRATICADLARANHISSDQFDCLVVTQTLQLVYDTRGAVTHMYRILRPGGVLLATVPALGRMSRHSSDYWRFTVGSIERVFGEVFGQSQIQVGSFGNVLAGIAFHLGMAYEELSSRELNVNDPSHPLVVTVRAIKRSPE